MQEVRGLGGAGAGSGRVDPDRGPRTPREPATPAVGSREPSAALRAAPNPSTGKETWSWSKEAKFREGFYLASWVEKLDF